MSKLPLADRQVFLLGAVDDSARAVAVALAEAGATVSVSTAAADQQQEFVANSILNEAWSMGRAGAAFTVDDASLDELQAAIELKDSPLLIAMPAVAEAAWPYELASIVGTDLISVRAAGTHPAYEIEARNTGFTAPVRELGAMVVKLAAALPRTPSPPP